MSTQSGSLENTLNTGTNTLRKGWDFLRRHRNIFLLVATILLIVVAVVLVNLLVEKTFKPYFNCAFVIDNTLGAKDNLSLCNGVRVKMPGITIAIPKIPAFNIGPLNIDIPAIPAFTTPSFPEPALQVTPKMSGIDGPLEALRKFIAWNFIVAFAVISLVLTFVVRKFKVFIDLLRKPEGRRMILSNVSIWLLFFAAFCILFYFGVVIRR